MASDTPIIVVQARLSSQRLPGKVLRAVAGRPMIDYLISRLRQCRLAKGVVIATSDTASDDPLAAWASEHDVPLFRGSLDNVAGRLLDAARSCGGKTLVRICGDSPLMDPKVIDHMIALYQATPCDLATNIQLRTFPKGMSVEVMAVSTLEEAMPLMTEAGDREHVTPFFYRNAMHYRIVGLTSGQDLGAVQMSVDTAEDFNLFEAMAARLGSSVDTADMRTVLAIRQSLTEESQIDV